MDALEETGEGGPLVLFFPCVPETVHHTQQGLLRETLNYLIRNFGLLLLLVILILLSLSLGFTLVE